MLSRFNGHHVRVITKTGDTFAGVAKFCPSSLGPHDFDQKEESLRIGHACIFKSDIRQIESLDTTPADTAFPRIYDSLVEELLEADCWIVDILPQRVPAQADGQYFAVERYFLQPERLPALRRRYAELLLRLNCYDNISVSFDGGERWEYNPDPAAFVDAVAHFQPGAFLRAVFPARHAMIDMDACDTYMTLFDPQRQLIDRVRSLSAAEGFFVWKSEEK